MYIEENPADIAVSLRLLMDHVSERDRCTLCKAAELIEKPKTSSDWHMLMLFVLLLFGGFDSDSEFLKSFANVLDKMHQQASTDSSESAPE